MATREEVMQAIVNADKKGDSASVRQLGAYLKTLDAAPETAAPTQPERQQGIVDEMSGFDKFRAGAGKAFVDLGRGVKQLVDVPAVALEEAFGSLGGPSAKASAAATQAEVDEAKQRDAPLMNSGAGMAGNLTGNVAVALPSVFVPGAASIPGAALTGAALGAVQPVATGESRATNTAIGGVAGAAGPVLGRTVAATWKGSKALVEPFTTKGREAIAGRTLGRFGVDAGDVAGLTGAPTTTGARTTLAEQITRPEGAAAAARLQDSVRALDPEIAAKFAGREIENNAARVGTLRGLAGQDGARDFAEAMRADAGKKLYKEAFDTPMDFSTLSTGERGELTKIMKMPAVKDAMKMAREMTANQGKRIDKPDGSIEGMHLMKLAMDDMIQNAGTSAVQVNKAKSIEMAQKRLLSFMQRMSPAYAEARGTYAAMSKPLNQMDVAGEALKRGASATGDLAGNPRLMPNSMANAMKDEGRLIKQATGRDLNTTLADLLDPDQLGKLKAVAGEVDRLGAVERAGNGPGSATAQRLASQNVLRQVLGPTGLPESWAESTLLNTAMRPVQFAYNGIAEPRIQQVLAELLLDPSKAQIAMQAAKVNPASLRPEVRAAIPYLEQALRVSAPAATVSGQR